MKKILLAALAFSAFSAFAQNYSDDLDKNTVPEAIEERENEIVNQSDSADENAVPASLEDREKQEDIESDLIQNDDPEKIGDPADRELDEQEVQEEVEKDNTGVIEDGGYI